MQSGLTRPQQSSENNSRDDDCSNAGIAEVMARSLPARSDLSFAPSFSS